ncbi:MAG: preprotein translocase subunit SecG [Clostridia bacterium]|nr:preprotein translocase subunit SecG [Clostridia bacterium]
MGVLEIVLGSVLLVAALFLVIAIVLQEGKKHGLSGAITGGAETFFGKTKGKDVSNFLKRSTTIVAIVFAVLVFVTYLFSGILIK